LKLTNSFTISVWFWGTNATDETTLVEWNGTVAGGGAQVLRPDSDLATNGWKTAPLWSKLDEETADDGDYIYISGPGSYTEASLSNPAGTPGSGSVEIHWRGKKLAGRTVAIGLYQGTNQIFGSDYLWITAWTTYTNALSQPQIDSITDYNDLRFRFISSGYDFELPGQASVS
jgi:hypothetical protein